MIDKNFVPLMEQKKISVKFLFLYKQSHNNKENKKINIYFVPTMVSNSCSSNILFHQWLLGYFSTIQLVNGWQRILNINFGFGNR